MTWWLAVVGTDTGVGKTCAAAAFRDWCTSSGRDVAAVKPFVSGAERGIWEDLERLDPEGRYPGTPARYHAPLSPYGAIRMGEPEVAVAEVERWLSGWTERPLDGIIVEGIGGVHVPVDRRELWIDLHARWHWPALVVGRAGLGTINHTLMTFEVLQARGIEILGFVLAMTQPLDRDAGQENAAIIAERSGFASFGLVEYDFSLNSEKDAGCWEKGVRWADLEESLCRRSK